MMPEVLVGLLAEPTRMRVFAAVVLGATTPAEVAEQTNLTAREVAGALRRLSDGGLVGGTATALAPRLEVFKNAARERATTPVAEPLDADRARAAVLRTFLVDGRLVSIPAARGKRRIVLEHIAAAFEPGVRYPEREVNAVYWRIGGPVPL